MKIEEKVRRYDEAINTIRNLVKAGLIYEDAAIQVFPELKDSEDERIVKELLTFFRESIHGGHILTNKEYDSWIAWLEKQGEQKLQGKSALEAAKEEKVDNQNCVKPADNKGMNIDEEFINALGTMLNDGLHDRYLVSEERIKMSAELLFSIARKQVKNEMQAWSEEDGDIRDNIIRDLKRLSGDMVSLNQTYQKEIQWLKSLKDRVQPQLKQEWSEEDEKKRNLLISILKINHPNGYFKVNPANTLNMEAMHTEELVDWLKSLRPQSQWKPSNEQMKALKEATDKQWDVDGDALWHLYQDLKKLREE